MFEPLRDRYQINSIFDERWQGDKDNEWLLRVKPEGWIVVTADKGRGKRGDKLPLICFTQKITHIRLAPNVHNMKMAEKALFLIAAIREWSPQTFGEAGRAFSLIIHANGRPKLNDRTEQVQKRYSWGT